MAFLTAEDAALHEALQGVLVQDVASLQRGGNREATVRFRLPEDEAAEEHYPFISVDLLDVARSTRREHRGRTYLQYLPDEPEYEGYSLAQLGAQDFPIPYDLLYQVTTYARNWQHDRAMLRGLMRGPFREREHNYLVVGGTVGAHNVDTIHSPDATIRMMEVIGKTQAHGRDRNGKRVFRHVFTVRVESELPQEVAALAAARVESIVITLNAVRNPEQITV